MIKRRLRFGAFLIAVSVIMLGTARLLSHEKMYRMTSGEYIKWVDFSVTAEAMNDALAISLDAYEKGYDADFVKLLSYLGAKYGGDFRHYKKKDLSDIYDKIKNGEKLDAIGAKYNYYLYYLEAYGAVLSEYVGEFYIDGKQYYGLRVFSPIAKGYYYNHSDDFGASRSYGYNRKHLGHDLMGSVGTPVIAIESGYVEALGWNQYGGWRIGIRSFDNKRYYYYAHLRKDHPYVSDLKEGDIVNAGQVIGYLGMTGYSAKENVNNIKTPHLHFGIQLIFDQSQKDGYNQIWIDCYELTKFLSQNRMGVIVSTNGKDRVAEKDVIMYDIPD